MNVKNGSTPVPSSTSKMKVKTAGLIIIGDEILKGQVQDTNSYFLCKELYSLGVKVVRINVIGDEVADISEEVRKFSSTYDLVFTTGGIGPTHDDMTYLGVAMAFDESVALHEEMAQLFDKWLGQKGFSKDVIMRMAKLPESAKLVFDPTLPRGTSFPIVVVHNVHVFPGVPQFLEKMFPRMRAILDEEHCNNGESCSGEGNNRFHSGVIYLNKDELSITPQIDLAVEKFKDCVTFGSYPVYGNLYYSTRLTMESSSPEKVQEAKAYLNGVMPANSVIQYDDQPALSASEKVYGIIQDETHPLHTVVKMAVTVSYI
jgi:FAD synthetase